MSRTIRFIIIGMIAMVMLGSLAVAALLVGRNYFTIDPAKTTTTVAEPLVIPSIMALPADPGPAVADAGITLAAAPATANLTAVSFPAQQGTEGDVSPQHTTVQYILARGDVNIRSGPGTGYRVVGWLAAGQTARVTGMSRDGLWWRVVCPDGSTGSCWVTALSQYTQPTTGPGGGPPPPEYIVARTGVNIRRGPGMNFGVIGWLSAGQTARVTGRSNNGLWWRIVCPDGSTGNCWVTARSQYTQPTSDPGGPPTSVRYILALTDLNIRRGPGTGYAVIGWISAGRTTRVTGISNDGLWWRVVCPDGSTGSCWVTARSQYTRPTSDPGVPPTTVQYILALTDLNIRRGPGTGHGVIGWVAAGQIAKVTGVSNDGLWWRVICPDNTVGSCWVTANSRYTRPTTPPGGGSSSS